MLKLNNRSIETDHMVMELHNEVQTLFPRQEEMFRNALHQALDRIRQHERDSLRLSNFEDDGPATGWDNRTRSDDGLEP